MNDNLQNKQDVKEIDLLKLLKVLWKRIWIILIAAFVCGAVSFAYTKFTVTPMYRASALLYVNNRSLDIGSTKVNISTGDISASSSLISTYSVILKSRTTLEQAIEEGHLPYSYNALRGMVSGSAEGDTPIFKITVTNSDPEMAANVCNTIVEIMVDPNTGISGIVEGSSVSVIDYAVVPTVASSPNYTRQTEIGMLIGFVLSCGVIILISLLDTTIREEDYLLDKFKDIPVLSTIPDLTEDSSGGYYGYGNSYAKSSEKARKSALNSNKGSEV